ncbi:hypothetical protein [Coralloluteibacterium thermophilus]|uniref:Uncharacterized protein n=1 Tax=Coralloluteibacterium thermophilum TaxID=2707049 RepID=A0ABV9NI13_9GAMM
MTGATTIIAPRAPATGRGWSELPRPPSFATLGYTARAFRHAQRGLLVISAVEVAKDADGVDRGPEYHLSVSREPGRRCSSADARQVLRDFDLDEAEEDNHVANAIVRNFWRPVADRFVGMECGCKAEETAIVEDRGDYVWRHAPEQRRG